ncbi:MAG: DUF2281 domain-containing protein [Synergistaceae bacterium]|nr:DUF2281 domain-containing protein [Synergistaceae bacterium]
MTLREEAALALETVPDFKLSELIHYMRFLSECPVSLGQPDKPRGKPRDLPGLLRGKIKVADDFDDPMELVFSSELKKLREAAERNSAVPQEAVV